MQSSSTTTGSGGLGGEADAGHFVAALDSTTASFWSAFFNSIAMIIVTELGDKTFFIAAVMAMRHPRLVVYLGAMGALAGMTLLSAVIGYALPHMLPRVYTHYTSIVLFAFFGFKLLGEAYEGFQQKTPKKNEELEEVEEQLGSRLSDGEGTGKHHETNGGDVEKGTGGKAVDSSASSSSGGSSASGSPPGGSSASHNGATTIIGGIAVITQAFTLTFVAEWGDRSQIATIALASVNNPAGVTLGGIIGHGICTGLAVLGGRFLATRISERQVALAGGILFWIFALHSLVVGP